MTTPDPTREPAPGTRPPLLRSRDDRVLAGVAGGLGRWLDVDPVIFRVTFTVLTLFGGIGLIGYLVGYLLIPDAATGVALVSSRLLPDLRRLTPQQRTLLAWGLAALIVVFSIADHHSTTFIVLGIVLAVVGLSITSRAARPATGASSSPPPGNVVPPGAAFASPATTYVPPTAYTPPASTWQEPAPPVQYAVKGRGPRLNRAIVSAAVLAAGLYLLVGQAGAYGPTALQTAAVALTTLGVGLAATAWHARSRVALVLGALLTAFVMTGSAVQGDYGTSVGSRDWRPVSAGTLPYEYRLGAGSATLDLSALGSAAVGHTIRVSMGAGKLTVLVPAGLLVSAYGHVQIGGYSVFDQRFENDPVRENVVSPGWTPATGVRIIAQLRVGNVEVDHA